MDLRPRQFNGEREKASDSLRSKPKIIGLVGIVRNLMENFATVVWWYVFPFRFTTMRRMFLLVLKLVPKIAEERRFRGCVRNCVVKNLKNKNSSVPHGFNLEPLLFSFFFFLYSWCIGNNDYIFII